MVAVATGEKKRVVERLGRSELEHGAEEVAAGKRMTRLPQAEIDSVLATVMDDDRLPPDFRALKRHNPDLVPSPEEEMDEEMMELYDEARLRRGIMEYHAWVRNQSLKLQAIAFREARGYS